MKVSFDVSSLLSKLKLTSLDTSVFSPPVQKGQVSFVFLRYNHGSELDSPYTLSDVCHKGDLLVSSFVLRPHKSIRNFLPDSIQHPLTL